MHKVKHSSAHPIAVNLLINGKKVNMEVDTGSAVTIIFEKLRNKVFPKATLQRSSLILKTCTGETMPVLGEIAVEVKYGAQQCSLMLTVVAGKGFCLLGRDWLKDIKLD